jgi:RNA polymerase primary sigma factor
MVHPRPFLDNVEDPHDDEVSLISNSRRRKDGDQLQSPLETYLREINETKLLTAEDEQMLARLIAKGDVQARDRMVRANLRLVVNIARSYVGKGLALQDLIEEGNLGLLRATPATGSSNRSNGP